ncbi:SusC/RagA family TonB-linked outer membrane protein [Sphingobacterium spiritivorum]|uniref:SusC/RagA family TonB-linked outer membrane protein n=1 Tax=Sphingobacterium spiritivorum TaxID=258 RepID=UPI003DA3E335
MRKLAFLIFSLLISTSVVWGQQIKIRGIVKDKNGEPLKGVSVTIKNSKSGVSTNEEGRFIIEDVSEGSSLLLHCIGFLNKEIVLQGNEELTITMDQDVNNLAEVVVTSLGIKRSVRKSANAVQMLPAAELTTVISGNPMDNLAGKVAGLQVTGGTAGLTSSSRVILRGENSLNIDNNSPMFVIDGTPISNRIFGSGGNATNQTNLPTDFGNGMMDLNMEDVENVSVLKGGAAALYGSRAANGVILITTKKGQSGRSLQVYGNSSTLFMKPILPIFQSEYGQGFNSAYALDYGSNFGPKMDGSSILQEGSPEFLTKTPVPFIRRYFLDDFFRTGNQFVNNIGIQGDSEKASYRVSYTNNSNKGTIPNTDLYKNTFSTHTQYKLLSNLNLNTSITYVKTKSNNVPSAGYGGEGLMYTLYWNHLNNDMNWFRDYWAAPGEKNVKQNYSLTWADNPFFIAYENINAFNRNRLFGNVSLDYKLSDHFSVLARTGLDYQSEQRFHRRAKAAMKFPNGMLRTQDIYFQESNTDVLASYTTEFASDFQFDLTAGTSFMRRIFDERMLQSNSLTVPEVYSLNNTNGFAVRYQNGYRSSINSYLATANIGYKDILYIDGGVRYDKTSTLSKEKNSYFYPSGSFSWLMDRTFSLGEDINMLKLRGNIAKIGKDTDANIINRTYQSGYLPGTFANSSLVVDPALKNEETITRELGIELLAFRNRLNFTFNYFNNLSKDQIIAFPVSFASGAKRYLTNGGRLKNFGIEATLNYTPIRNKDFEWTTFLNFTKMNSKILELPNNMNYVMAEGPASVTVEARVGGRMGDIYGYKFQRSPDGQIIYQANGLPAMTAGKELIGNYNPDFMLGFRNQFKYKGATLSFLFDIRKGGTLYSYTNTIGAETGMLPFTLDLGRDRIVGNGVVKVTDANGGETYQPNTKSVAAYEYYFAGGYYNRQNAESNSFDASYIKLRELSIGYVFKAAQLKALRVHELGISLVARNLLRWTKTPQFLDPETMGMNGGTLLPGIEVMQYPVTQNYGFNVNFKF